MIEISPQVKATQLLECSIAESNYLLNCSQVREVISLPALTSVSGELPYIAGLMSLRGEILCVINASVLLKQESDKFRLSDKVVIIEGKRCCFGILVQSTQQVISSSELELQSMVDADDPSSVPLTGDFFAGIAHSPKGLFPILDLEKIEQSLSHSQTDAPSGTSFEAKVREGDLQQFTLRADALRERDVSEEGSADAFAVIEIGNELYALPLAEVTEFLVVDTITPVPCCPSYVVGNTNWRGDVLTVIDISSALELPALEVRELSKVIVFGQKREALGIVVNEIHDVCHLQAADIMDPPPSIKITAEGYLRGVADKEGRKLGILCPEQLLAIDKWRVAELV